MEQLEKVKNDLADKRIFLEKELDRVKKVEKLLLDNPDEIVKTLLATIKRRASNYGLLVYEVRRAVDSLTGGFTVRDVRNQIIRTISTDDESDENLYNKPSISVCLIHLKQSGVLEELKKGKGSIPNLYKLKS